MSTSANECHINRSDDQFYICITFYFLEKFSENEKTIGKPNLSIYVTKYRLSNDVSFNAIYKLIPNPIAFVPTWVSDWKVNRKCGKRWVIQLSTDNSTY